jgi:hypothetical protein
LWRREGSGDTEDRFVLCFEGLVDLLVKLLIRPCSLGCIKIAAPHDTESIALTVESGADVLEAA